MTNLKRSYGKGLPKVLAVISLLCLLFSLGVVTVSAASNAANVTVSSCTVERGTAASVAINLEGNPGIWGIKLRIHYDHSALTLESVNGGVVFEEGELTFSQDLSKDPYVVVASGNSLENKTADGAIFTLNFTVNSNAEFKAYPVTVEVSQAYSVDGNKVKVDSVDGGVTVVNCVHASKEWRVTKTAKCEEAGVETQTCTKCEATFETRSIKATGHQHTELKNAKDATKTAEGYTGDTYCKDCGKLISKGKPIAKLPSDTTVTNPPTEKPTETTSNTPKPTETTSNTPTPAETTSNTPKPAETAGSTETAAPEPTEPAGSTETAAPEPTESTSSTETATEKPSDTTSNTESTASSDPTITTGTDLVFKKDSGKSLVFVSDADFSEFTVTFHVNGGDEFAEADNRTKTVTYDGTYGSLPTATKSGYGFIGWFTSREGGTEVTAENRVTVVSDQTLYAHWRLLKNISTDVFDFGEAESYYYDTGITYDIVYTFRAEAGETYTEDSFMMKYKAQNADEYVDVPFDPGVYDVLVSRAEDDCYTKFEYLYTGVLIVKEYVANGSYFIVRAGVKGGVGGSHTINNTITWSDGYSQSFSLDIDKGTWQYGYSERCAVNPSAIRQNGSYNLQNMHLSSAVFDIMGNQRVIENDYVKKTSTKVDKTWSLGSYPNVDYSMKNFEVSADGKIRVRIDTYGFDGVLSKQGYTMTYATTSSGTNDLPFVEIDGDYFIIDGSQITSEQTVSVYARNSGGKYCKVTSFKVSHSTDSQKLLLPKKVPCAIGLSAV